MKSASLRRYLDLLMLLQGPNRYSARELADKLKISQRTVYRYIRLLRETHIPIEIDDERGGYHIPPGYFLPPVHLTFAEALGMLALADNGRSPLRGLPLWTHLTSGINKLATALPRGLKQEVFDSLDVLRTRLAPTCRGDDLAAEHFEELADACRHRRICKLRYQSLYEQKTIVETVHPMQLQFVTRAWYLAAWVPKHNDFRTFKLLRIKGLDVLGKSFPPRDPAALEEHFGGAWSMIPEGRMYDVVIRFAPKVATNVAEVRWHASQKTKFLPDGSLEFRVKVNGINEIYWWILGYGDQAEVISPAPLRRRLATTARDMAKLYAKK